MWTHSKAAIRMEPNQALVMVNGFYLSSSSFVSCFDLLSVLHYLLCALHDNTLDIFTVKSFDADFPLMTNIDGCLGRNINMPEGIR